LAGPPYRTREGNEKIEPVAGGDTCVYETPDFHAVLITVTWKDGAMALKALSMLGGIVDSVGGTAETAGDAKKAAKLLLPGGIEIDGEWDEARRLGCCQIYALRGDRLINYDYRAWRDDTEHAVVILNKALTRLDSRLGIDGNAGIDAARAHAARRPKPVPVCGILSRAEVEAVLGPLLADPKPSEKDPTEACTYRFTQAAAKGSPLGDAPKEFTSMVSALTGGRTGLAAGPVDTAVTIFWRGGFRRLADAALVGGAVTASYAGMEGMPKRTAGRVQSGPWQDAMQTGLEFSAVKNDVGVTIDAEPMLSQEQVELRRRLVAKVIEKL
jgi:hypothetical protein